MTTATVTIPLSPGRYALIQFPSRTINREEWRQMLAVLEAMQRGLVTPSKRGVPLRRQKQMLSHMKPLSLTATNVGRFPSLA